MLSNRANTICLLQVFQKYSDEEHILPMREIIAKLRQNYDIDLDRRTIYSTVELLQQFGYDISTYEENGQGYYLRSRLLEPSELNLLINAVHSFPFIPAAQSRKLIQKLQSIGSVYQGKKYRHLSVLNQDRKTENKQVFLNIELLDEAIEQRRKVSFTYLSYNEKMCLVPRRKAPYIVSPFGMTYTNEHYYLSCMLQGHENASLYRIDRMRELAILDEKTDQPDMDTAIASGKSVYAFTGAPEEIMFAFDKAILNDVVDRFGTVISLTDDKERYIARLTAPPRGVKFWALQYLPYVEILRPLWLRESIIESIRQNKYVGNTKGDEYETH